MPTWIRTLVLLALTTASSLGIASPSVAGTYDVFSCLTPAGASAPVTGWTSAVRGGARAYDTCASGDGFGGGDTAAESGAGVSWRFAAPPDTTITAFSLHRTIATPAGGPPAGRWYGRYSATAGTSVIEYCQGDAPPLCPVLGDSTVPLSAANSLARDHLDDPSLMLAADCSGACGPGARTGSFRIFRSMIVLRDVTRPELTSFSGGLFAPGPVSGNVRVSFVAGDRGGGVASVETLVDGRVVARSSPCAPPFTDPIPCPLLLRGEARVDTSRLGDGLHAAAVRVTDAAGLVAQSVNRLVEVRNGPGANGSPPSRRAGLVLAFEDGRRVRGVSFGARPRLHGRLTAPGGRPIASALVIVTNRIEVRGGRFRRVHTVRTGADGRFSFGRRAARPAPSRSPTAPTPATVAGPPTPRCASGSAPGSGSRSRRGACGTAESRCSPCGSAAVSSGSARW